MKIEKSDINDYTELAGTCSDWTSRKSLWGVAPVAPIHLGFDSLVLLQKEAISLGVKRHYVIIADLHALMTKGMTWKENRARSYYYEFYFKEICKLENTDFLLGSFFQTRTDYVEELYSSMRDISLSKVRETMPSSAKNQTVYSFVAVYALMQCLDIFHVNANYVLAENAQKKIYDLVPDIANSFIQRTGIERNFTTGLNKMSFAYVKPAYDILGQNLNLSSSGSRISIHETDTSLIKKIKKMSIPPLGATFLANPLLETFKFSVFPWFDVVSVKGLNGSIKEYYDFKQFESDYYNQVFHSIDAKNELYLKLRERISTTQSLMAKGITNWINIDKAASI
ncbi:hypothetical protein [Dyadobacter sp. 32]|uniref:hypothetical protein n=1 Tax=Dyadobacter sp. 32 TaxID=538966 RepID=UPI0011EE71E5